SKRDWSSDVCSSDLIFLHYRKPGTLLLIAGEWSQFPYRQSHLGYRFCHWRTQSLILQQILSLDPVLFLPTSSQSGRSRSESKHNEHSSTLDTDGSSFLSDSFHRLHMVCHH